MSNKHLDITVDISIIASAGSLGFGIPLLLVSKAKADMEYTKIKGLKELSELLGEGYAETELYKAAQLLFMQDNAPSEIAVCMSTKKATEAIVDIEEKDWRQLICILGESDSTKVEVAEYIETLEYKMFYATVTTLEEATALNEKGLDKTVIYFYDYKETVQTEGTDGETVNTEVLAEPNAVAALVGASAGRDVGSFTYKNLILKGLVALDKTSNELAELEAVNAITNIEKCGDNVTTEGKTASGEYIDIIDSIDYIKSQIEYRVQKLLNKAPKIPYTNAGIGGIEAEVIGVLNKAFRNGIIAENEGLPQYSTNFKTREEMSAEDRANRVYTGGNFSFDLAGAIHKVHIDGELVI